jgi:hypothetical protein
MTTSTPAEPLLDLVGTRPRIAPEAGIHPALAD